MNPLTNVRNILNLNKRELELNVPFAQSWHQQYRDSAWVFIGGLDYDLTEGDIICVFSQYGEIVNINLVRDKKTGKSKGFAFLCYENQISSVLSVDNLNSAKLCGRTVRVDHVEEYKVPKMREDLAPEQIKLALDGCAPQPVPVIDRGDVNRRDKTGRGGGPNIKQEEATEVEGGVLPPRLFTPGNGESSSTLDKSKEKKNKKSKKSKLKKDKKSKKSKKKHKHSSRSDSSGSDSGSSSDSEEEEDNHKSKKRRCIEREYDQNHFKAGSSTGNHHHRGGVPDTKPDIQHLKHLDKFYGEQQRNSYNTETVQVKTERVSKCRSPRSLREADRWTSTKVKQEYFSDDDSDQNDGLYRKDRNENQFENYKNNRKHSRRSLSPCRDEYNSRENTTSRSDAKRSKLLDDHYYNRERKIKRNYEDNRERRNRRDE